MTNNMFWNLLLHTRFNIELDENENAFEHLTLLSHTFRCAHCLRMEGHQRRLFVDSFGISPCAINEMARKDW
jgi:hypothetical protein